MAVCWGEADTQQVLHLTDSQLTVMDGRWDTGTAVLRGRQRCIPGEENGDVLVLYTRHR